MLLEFLVHKQTQATAAAYGLLDRGVLAPGLKADINVIDYQVLGVLAPEVVYDLPTGGRRIIQKARGYRHVFVSGTETIAKDQFTGNRPGRLVRGCGLTHRRLSLHAAVDAKHHMIVAHEVTTSVTDQGQLPAMAKVAQEAIGHPKPTVLADRGYFAGYDVLECESAGIETLVPKPLTSNSKAHGRFDKRDFIYDASRDVYRCPAGQIAIYPVHRR